MKNHPENISQRLVWELLVPVLIVLATAGQPLSGAQAATAPGQDAALPFATYLPLLANSSVAPPTPSPDSTPISVNVVPDAGRSVSAAIGLAGGVITATSADGSRFALTLPAKSLLVTTTITLTPLTRIDGLPFSGGLGAGVQLEPDGLQLWAPADLQITPAHTIPIAEQSFFDYTGGGANFALYPPTLNHGAQIVLALLHFSGYGVAQGSASERAAIQQRPPAPINAQISSRIAELLRSQRERALAGMPIDPVVQDTIVALLRIEFARDIQPEVEAALAGSSLEAIMQAVRDIFTWERTIELLGVADRFSVEHGYITAALPRLLKRADAIVFQRCTVQHELGMVNTLLTLERQAQLLGISDGELGVNPLDQIGQCLSFRLDADIELVWRGPAGPGDATYTSHVRAHVPLKGDGSTYARLYGDGMLTYSGTGPHEVLGGSITFSTCATTPRSIHGSGLNVLVQLTFKLEQGPKGSFTDKLTVTYITALIDPGQLQVAVTIQCPKARPADFAFDTLGTLFTLAHGDELVNYQNTALPQIAGWQLGDAPLLASKHYDRSSAGIIEHSSFELRHMPA